MKACELLEKLQELVAEHGDLDITIADGYNYVFYQKTDDRDFDVGYFDGTIEIGVGGCDV